jgi:hypothetical protein
MPDVADWKWSQCLAELPLWAQLADIAFVAVVVPVYAVRYGPGNFLWFSDVALIGSVAALSCSTAAYPCPCAACRSSTCSCPWLVWMVNWVFAPGTKPQRRLHPLAYLAALMAFFPLAVYWPSHLVFGALFSRD